MIEDRIEKIQSTIQQAGNIPSERKAELLQLVAGLQSEIRNLSATHEEEASSDHTFRRGLRAEASRAQKNPQLAETALHGLRVSHPGTRRFAPSAVRSGKPFRHRIVEYGDLML